MSPTQLTSAPGTAEPSVGEEKFADRKGHEFVDGQWVPKHRDEPRTDIEEDRQGHEFIDGEWVEKKMGMSSAEIASNLHGLLNPFVRSRKLGKLFDADAGYKITPGKPTRVRKPDLSFIARDRLPDSKELAGFTTVVPDLAAEIISPNDVCDEIQTKIVEYITAGVRVVWVFYPASRSAMVFHKDRAARLILEDETLSGEDVIPGFEAKLSDVFSEE